MIATGSSRAFSHTVTTRASRDCIWRLWVDTRTWANWDLGLSSAASATHLLRANAEGQIVSRAGQKAKFKVIEWQDGEAYAFRTSLPFAALNVRRTFEHGQQTRFTHAVHFSGPLAGLWAALLGRGFREALPPTMDQLVRLAEGAEP